MEKVELTDGVIRLRPWTPADVDDVQAAIKDPEIPRYMSIPVDQPREATERFIGSRDEGWESGDDITWAVVDSRDGHLLGSVSVTRSADDPEVGEIGYWLSAEARGKGIATRATRLVADWALAGMKLYRLEITTHVDNVASRNVALRSGFREEGVLRGYRPHHDRRVDLVMFGRLRDDEPADFERGGS